HIPLNHHLTCIKKFVSPACLGCDACLKTVYHCLLICPAHRLARYTLGQKIDRQCMRIEHLLTNNKSLSHLFNFLNNTKRLKQTFGSLLLPTQNQPNTSRTPIAEA
ncbi:hypothetical protein V8B97DRAFT_1873412, partial [Scleroderma yunnanense]